MTGAPRSIAIVSGLWFGALSLATPLVAQDPAPIAPEGVLAIAGCYAVTLGEWQNPRGSDFYHRIAPSIRLDTAPGAFRGRPRPGSWALFPTQGVRPDEGASWRLTEGGDSVDLSWSTGFTGASVAAEIVGSDLDGLLTGFFDDLDGRPFPTRSFRASRIPCEGDAGVPVAPVETVEDIWGATPTTPSCYVPHSVVSEVPAEGGRAWGPLLLAMDTIVLEPRSAEGNRGWLRPALDGVPGYWSGPSTQDPRRTVAWGDYFASVTLRMGLFGDTLRGEGFTPGTEREWPRGSDRPTIPDRGSIQFEALRVDCGPGAPDRLPGVGVERVTAAARRLAGCYAFAPPPTPSAPVEPPLGRLLAQLGTFELRTEPAQEPGRPPSPTVYALTPALVHEDPDRRNPTHWGVDAAGVRVALRWGLLDAVTVQAVTEGDALVGRFEARIGPIPGGRLQGGGLLSRLSGDFRAERIPCGA